MIIKLHKTIYNNRKFYIDHHVKTSLTPRKRPYEKYKRLGENGAIATEEGNLLKPRVAHMTLTQCMEYCTGTKNCKSFTHCPLVLDRCSLFDRELTDNEPTKWNSYCSSYYRTKNPTILEAQRKGI